MERFITGATGAGKSKFAMSKLAEELRSTQRGIITNMAVKLDPWVNAKGRAYPGLLRSLQDRYGTDYDAKRRIWFLDPVQADTPWSEINQVQRFYGWRLVVPADPEIESYMMRVPESEDGLFHNDGGRYPGCAYFIEEAHEYFPQNEWQLVGKETMSWASQNRRAGDDAWLITQQAELVAKPFRRQSLECYWLVNGLYRRIGWFKARNTISYTVHVSTPPIPSQPAMHSGEIHGNEWLNGCYDTSAGGGVSGSTADLDHKPTGLSLKWIPLIALVVVCIAFFALEGCAKLTAKAITGVSGGSAPKGQVPPRGDPNRVTVVRGHLEGPATPAPVKLAIATKPQPAKKITGILRWGPKRPISVYFDDGTITEAATVIQEGSVAIINGQEYGLAR